MLLSERDRRILDLVAQYIDHARNARWSSAAKCRVELIQEHGVGITVAHNTFRHEAGPDKKEGARHVDACRAPKQCEVAATNGRPASPHGR
jgi:hypothetical protein